MRAIVLIVKKLYREDVHGVKLQGFLHFSLVADVDMTKNVYNLRKDRTMINWPEKKEEAELHNGEYIIGNRLGFNEAIDQCREAVVQGVPSEETMAEMICETEVNDWETCPEGIKELYRRGFLKSAKKIRKRLEIK